MKQPGRPPRSSLVLPWTPHAKGRPRATKGGHVYTPHRTRLAEKEILEAFTFETKDGAWPWFPYEGPLAVSIQLEDNQFRIDVSEVPQHQNRKLRGDIDNYAKTILDALNGHAWHDDRQIVQLRMEKL